MQTEPLPESQTPILLVQDFMTKDVLSVSPDMSVIEAAQIFFERTFDGLPVVDDLNQLLGILTQYDLVSKGANIHLPTFIQLMQDLQLYNKDKAMIKPGLEQIVSLKVADIMNTEPLIATPTMSLEEVSRMFTEHHRVNPIPVVNEGRGLVGIISRYDIMRLYTGTMAAATTITKEKDIDKKINLFVHHFEKNFIVVSKFRTKYWLLASALFAIAGFIIAFMLIARIEFN